MRVIKFNQILNSESLRQIKLTISNNGLIVYPTDTLYGLGGNCYSDDAIIKIDRLKNKFDAPYSIAVRDLDMVLPLIKPLNKQSIDIINKLLPGKFTVLFNLRSNIDLPFLKGRKKLGVRIPKIPEILQLIKYLEVPLISTSVNQTGASPLQDPEEIKQLIHNNPEDFILIDKGVLPPSNGSTIIDFTVNPPALIRRGDDFDKWLSICQI